jgi:hypothetical protein
MPRKTSPIGQSVSNYAKFHVNFAENNLKSVIYRHKLYIGKEQFTLPQNTLNSGDEMIW